VALPRYIIDGAVIRSLDDFYDQLERGALEGAVWGRNLDALDDVLGGQYGPVPASFELVWHDAAVSRQALGHEETVRQLRSRLVKAHSSNHATIRNSIALAEQGRGPTVYDWLLDIIAQHPNVVLRLT
jgi:RNAse (barnase) inhibitor barstar